MSLEAQDKTAELGSSAGRPRAASADPGPAPGIRAIIALLVPARLLRTDSER